MTQSDPPLPADRDSPRGFAFALGAYLAWGVLPLYMKALAHVSPAEVIAHRILWSLPVAGIILIWLGRTGDLRTALRNPRTLGMAALTAALISVNWGIYVWAIGAGHALDAALGYYINPLFSVLLGRVLLKERMTGLQLAAVALVGLAVAILAFDAGRPPWVALGLTVSWGFYAYLKKALPIGPNQGFFLEVLLLAPLAIAYLGWIFWRGGGHFLQGNSTDTLLLACAGVITAVPLMLYANGARALRLSTIAMMQYLTPTMIALIAVLVFREPFGTARAIAFPMIWVALALYTVPILQRAGRR
ncbi:MAG: EamA family transporter RarD [Paracoccaceae bacterium]